MTKKLSDELSGWIQDAPTGLILRDIMPRIKQLEADSQLLNGLIEMLEAQGIGVLTEEEAPSNDYMHGILLKIPIEFMKEKTQEGWPKPYMRAALEAAVAKWRGSNEQT